MTICQWYPANQLNSSLAIPEGPQPSAWPKHPIKYDSTGIGKGVPVAATFFDALPRAGHGMAASTAQQRSLPLAADIGLLTGLGRATATPSGVPVRCVRQFFRLTPLTGYNEDIA